VYSLRRDRCVLELTLRLLKFPWLRARFTESDGCLNIGADGDHTLEIELAPSSLWTTVPRLARTLTGPAGLRAEEYPAIVFVSRLDLFDNRDVEILGQVDIAETPRDLFLAGDLRYVDDERIVLWGKGILPAPRRRPTGGRIARLLSRRPIHIEIAAEFTR
jgi:polyisoprenoid-binding protein YceI